MRRLGFRFGFRPVLQAFGDLLDMMALDQLKQALAECGGSFRRALRHAASDSTPVISPVRVFRDRHS